MAATGWCQADCVRYWKKADANERSENIAEYI
jgi:hypothetical protein